MRRAGMSLRPLPGTVCPVMMRHVGGLIVVYLVLLGLAVVIVTRWSTAHAATTDEYSKLLTVSVAAISGFMAFVGSLFAVAAARRLEGLKADFQRQLESFKAVLPQDVEAMRTIVEAANRFYRTLALLEQGRWDQRRFEKADARMAEADLFSSNPVVRQFQREWYDFWQQGVEIGARGQAATDVAERREAWARSVGDFGRKLLAIRQRRHDFLASLNAQPR